VGPGQTTGERHLRDKPFQRDRITPRHRLFGQVMPRTQNRYYDRHQSRLFSSLLGVDLGACVAIEDSRTGVASALAAGCATLGVPHVVQLDPAQNLTIRDTLVGVTVNDLRALVG